MIFPLSPSAWLWLLYCGCIGYELPEMIRVFRRFLKSSGMRDLLADYPRWVGLLVQVYVVACVAPLLPVHTVGRVVGWIRRHRAARHTPMTPVGSTATGLLPIALVRGRHAPGLLASALFTDPGVMSDPYLAMCDWVAAYVAAGKPWQPYGWLVLAEGEKEPVFYTAEEFDAHFEPAGRIKYHPHDSLPD
jgi:hypothetical protein